MTETETTKRTLKCKLCPFEVVDDNGAHLPWRKLYEHFITQHDSAKKKIRAWINLIPRKVTA